MLLVVGCDQLSISMSDSGAVPGIAPAFANTIRDRVHQLVQEKKPHYFEEISVWPFIVLCTFREPVVQDVLREFLEVGVPVSLQLDMKVTNDETERKQSPSCKAVECSRSASGPGPRSQRYHNYVPQNRKGNGISTPYDGIRRPLNNRPW